MGYCNDNRVRRLALLEFCVPERGSDKMIFFNGIFDEMPSLRPKKYHS